MIKVPHKASSGAGIYSALGICALATLAVTLLVAACGGRSTEISPDITPTSTTTPMGETPTAGHTSEITQGGHEGTEGLVLGGSSGEETVYPAALCDSSAPVREYNLAAINVEISLNRFLDYDPFGRMFILEEELDRARSEEAQNRRARLDRAEPAVSIGLQGDAIQPLTIRVNQGECLRVNLHNAMDTDEAVSFHLHGSGLHLARTGAPAIATNPAAMVSSGESVTYHWMVNEDEPEGTHYFHSHGDTREQTAHGLFGALVVEPKGSEYLDPLTGGKLASGWAAIIKDPRGSDFREFAIYYHEIGNERFRNFNKQGRPVPFLDGFTDAYKPGGRALNYRSEPFMNRMELQFETFETFDPSLAYSSYAFGDPATPIARTYLGDPVKQRVIHGGSEVFHVHHVHGGATRWRRQPGAEPTAFDSGFDKTPPLLPQASARTDSQSIGPAENYDLEHECGSGGCQESAGDFLIHCHVAHHYIAGMWMIWRVQNTLQDGVVSQDSLPPLRELPGRLGLMAAAVTSQELVGQEVDWKGAKFQIGQDNLAEWVERQLPPQGAPKGYDASVLNWEKQDSLYLNEPETAAVWPGYKSAKPETRPPIYFDPTTGKLAYPFLRPHLGQRPPFAPNHGPAPFLEPIHSGTDPPQPGENGPWSLCPSQTRIKEFSIHAINLPITLNRRSNIVDPVGQLYVLKEEEEEVRALNARKTPLAIRTNATEDCIDVVFKSELEDTGENAFFSKANIHIHFVQFDIQGSDGVDTGFNYETSVRPFTVEGESVSRPAEAGETRVVLKNAQRFQAGALVGVGMDQEDTFEVRRISEIDGPTLVFDEPLEFEHQPGEIVSAEFVRYRWYPDAQFGTAYFHDHVSALTSWRHGLFGALIAEPPGSTYHDPKSGSEVSSGPIVDVHTQEQVSSDITGSFREMVLFLQDANPLTDIGRSSGSSINLRVEPLDARGGDPSMLFSSAAHGDPETPLLEAYLGDPIVIRGLVSATNDVHTLHVDGHWFRIEPFSLTSPPASTVHLGISERYDLSIGKAGGPQAMPGDYLYYNGRSFKFEEGSWGIIRVVGQSGVTPGSDNRGPVELQKLPGHESIPADSAEVCPPGAPVKLFPVSAVNVALPMLGGAMGKIYVLDSQREAVSSGTMAPEPLVLHVNVGDCIQVSLTNETQDGPVSIHPDMLAYDPQDSQGIAAGYGPVQAVMPGETRRYTFYAHPEVGETVAMVRDWGNVLKNPGLGLYGAIVVGPRGAAFTHPVTGEDLSIRSSWKADVHPSDGPSYRDFTLFIQDQDEVIGTSIMPYSEDVEGVLAVNYRFEPFGPRLERVAVPSQVFNSQVHGDPATPLLEAMAGDNVKLHVLAPFSEQSQVFSIEGHRWPVEPGREGSTLLSAVQIGAAEAITLELVAGAGGEASLPGDYIYGDHREPYREAGLWGIFRVHPAGSSDANILALP